jgi:hypothetical protein
MRRQIAELQSRIGPPAGNLSEFRQAQAKAQAVATAYGESAPPPLAGEQLADYRVRLASKYQVHSSAYKDSNLSAVRDPVALAAVEDAIYADAAREAVSPSSFEPGVMRPVVTRDAAGRPVIRYVGHEGACWDRFNPPVRYVRRFMTPNR